MYVVKLKTKESKTPGYANWSIILYKDQFNENYTRNYFIMPYDECQKLTMQLISRQEDPNDIRLEEIAIVKLTHYKPHSESEVVFYKEFK